MSKLHFFDMISRNRQACFPIWNKETVRKNYVSVLFSALLLKGIFQNSRTYTGCPQKVPSIEIKPFVLNMRCDASEITSCEWQNNYKFSISHMKLQGKNDAKQLHTSKHSLLFYNKYSLFCSSTTVSRFDIMNIFFVFQTVTNSQKYNDPSSPKII